MSFAPFRHSIRVRWADCDPAQIAYTGRIPYFALEAIDAFWEAVTGDDWFRLNVDRQIGVPFVHMSIDFRSPVTPRHPLHCEVTLEKVGNSSVGFAVKGGQNEVLCFEGSFIEAFVNAAHNQSIPIPDSIRSRLLPVLSDSAG